MSKPSMYNNHCAVCGVESWGTLCRAHYTNAPSVRGLKVCGVPNCGRYAPSLDKRYGRLCTMHNARLRARQKYQGCTEDEAYTRIDESTRSCGNSVISVPPAELNLEHVKKRICEPVGERVRPLLLFMGGNQTEGRIVALYNLLASAKDVEVKTFTSLTKATQLLTDPVHYCGLHTLVERMGLISFCSRLWYSPEVLSLESDWRDYLQFLFENSGEAPLEFRRISPLAYHTRRPWRLIYHEPIAPMLEHYPFIAGKPTSDHDLILAVDSLVPKYLPPDTRADVCQDMIVSVLTGEITLDNLRDSTKQYIKNVFKNAPSKYGALSLDAPQMFGDEMGRTLGETISSHR